MGFRTDYPVRTEWASLRTSQVPLRLRLQRTGWVPLRLRLQRTGWAPLRLRFGRTGCVFISSWGLSNRNLFFLSDWKPEDK